MAITPSVEHEPAEPDSRASWSPSSSSTPPIGRRAGRDMLLPDLGLRRARAASGAAATRCAPTPVSALGTLSWTPRRPGLLLMKNVLPLVLIGLAISILIVSALGRRLFSASRALEAREAAAQHLANHDALTGLPNRRQLESEFASFTERSRAGRRARSPSPASTSTASRTSTTRSATMPATSSIRGLADRLRGAVREGDFVARLGGDEFAIMRNLPRRRRWRRPAGRGARLLRRAVPDHRPSDRGQRLGRHRLRRARAARSRI